MSTSQQQDPSASPSPVVWFQLLDDSSQPYMGTSVSSILRSSLAVPSVDQFRDVVKAKYADSHTHQSHYPQCSECFLSDKRGFGLQLELSFHLFLG
jgi:hypothetical protein